MKRLFVEIAKLFRKPVICIDNKIVDIVSSILNDDTSVYQSVDAIFLRNLNKDITIQVLGSSYIIIANHDYIYQSSISGKTFDMLIKMINEFINCRIKSCERSIIDAKKFQLKKLNEEINGKDN